MHQNLLRGAFWIAFVFACGAAGKYLHTGFFVALAFTAVFVFGNYFVIVDKRAEYLVSNPPKKTAGKMQNGRFATAFALLVGSAWALLLGSGIAGWRLSQNSDLSGLVFLGMPYALPTGALMFGTMAPMGYCFAIDRIGRRFTARDFFPIVAMSFLVFAVAQSVNFADADVSSIAGPVPGQPGAASGGAFRHISLSGPAPIPALTLPLEFLAYLIGGYVAFLRQIPETFPWSRPRRTDHSSSAI